jgi:hypothetical protein
VKSDNGFHGAQVEYFLRCPVPRSVEDFVTPLSCERELFRLSAVDQQRSSSGQALQ